MADERLARRPADEDMPDLAHWIFFAVARLGLPHARRPRLVAPT